MAVGQSFAFVGLVSSIILQAFFSGAPRLSIPRADVLRVLPLRAYFRRTDRRRR